MAASSTDVVLRPATELARLVRSGELSAAELLELHVQRIEAVDPQLNALVLPRLDEARREAAAADRARAAGDPGDLPPLHGVPFTVKDPIAVAGMPWPNGSKLFRDVVAGYDAPAVRRMREAGALLVGKTNVPEFSGFYDTANDLFGVTRNPHAPDRSAGGSSGGEAVAVAAGMSAIGVGSDLTSSIRNPAHFTGIFGLKPSRHLVPAAGHAPDGETPAFSRLAAIGPLARSAGDLELALRVLADAPPAEPRPGGGTVGVYDEDLFQPVADDCRRAVRLAAAALADAGHRIVEEAPPRQGEIRACVDAIVAAELLTELAGPAVGREAELSAYGRMVLSAAPGVDRELGGYLQTWRDLGAHEREVDEWFERRRLALCPVAPGPAPLIGTGFTEIDGRPVAPGPKMTFSVLANGAGLPAASVPVLLTEAGLPVGVQVIGGRGRDLEVVAAARVLEQAFGGFVAPPLRPA